MKLKNLKHVKTLLEQTFEGLIISEIKIIGAGYDSVAYLVNNEYIFKIKYSTNKKKGYAKEKAIYDFINKNLKSKIQVPKVDYSLITDEISILGYKQIKGEFLSPEKYSHMTAEQQDKLKKDLALFLNKLHNLNVDEISEYSIDNKANVLEEYDLLKTTIYNSLKDYEQQYIEDFMGRLHSTGIFDGKKCLCHNDFSCNHILLNENNEFVGVIDFGDAGVIDECCDFIYLLEDSDEEIGSEFGKDVLKFYKDLDFAKAKEYQDVVEQYYPIETIVYGVKNNRKDFIRKGRKEIKNRVKEHQYQNVNI